MVLKTLVLETIYTSIRMQTVGFTSKNTSSQCDLYTHTAII